MFEPSITFFNAAIDAVQAGNLPEALANFRFPFQVSAWNFIPAESGISFLTP
jgi:hypothetical protein